MFPSTCQKIELDETIAQKIQEEWNSCKSEEDSESQETKTLDVDYANISNYRDVVQELASKVKHDNGQFFIATRKAPFDKSPSPTQQRY